MLPCEAGAFGLFEAREATVAEDPKLELLDLIFFHILVKGVIHVLCESCCRYRGID
jgi:hypothetical protein